MASLQSKGVKCTPTGRDMSRYVVCLFLETFSTADKSSVVGLVQNVLFSTTSGGIADVLWNLMTSRVIARLCISFETAKTFKAALAASTALTAGMNPGDVVLMMASALYCDRHSMVQTVWCSQYGAVSYGADITVPSSGVIRPVMEMEHVSMNREHACQHKQRT